MSKQPNFLFLFPDQWRYDALSAYGHQVAETPFIDDIVNRGLSFTSAYSACPSCIATRASLMSGLSPYSSGRVGYSDYIPWEYDSLVQRLRDGGYHTMCVGKTHFYPERAHLGFEELELYSNQDLDGDNPSDYHKWLEHEGKGLVEDTALAVSSTSWPGKPWTASEKLHPSTWNANRCIELLRRRDPQRPFFMKASFHRPHPPYDPPFEYYEMYKDVVIPEEPHGEWSNKYARPVKNSSIYYGDMPKKRRDDMLRCYYAQIAHLDYQIGRILYYLHTEGLDENTYIIFSTDHGDMMGDHYMSSKYRPWEGSAKIPFVITPPLGMKDAKIGEDATPVTHMDMLPTFMDLAGIPIPEHVEGKSLAPIIMGKELKGREYIHGEHVMAKEKQGWQYLTDGKIKYAWETMSGEEFFFDLQNDPKECENLIDAPEEQARIETWRKRLVDILAQREEEGLSDGQKLIPGKVLPPITSKLKAPTQKMQII